MTIDRSNALRSFEPALREYLEKFTLDSAIEDVIQETLSVAAKRVQEGENVGKPLGLLFSVARDIVMSKRLYMKHPPEKFMNLRESVLPSSPAGSSAVATKAYTRLSAAVSSLPVELKHPFILERVYGLEVDAIAEECGISVAMADERIAEARQRIHELLGDGAPVL